MGHNADSQPLVPPTVDVDLDLTPATPAEHPLALPPGHVLQEYRLEAVLGVGGFGITYLAHDQHLQCQVAIKEYLPSELATRGPGGAVIPRSTESSQEYRDGLTRFLSETRVLASFRHPHIVRVNRFFEANGSAYMVMDYEQGQPLRHWIKAHGPASETQLRRMFAGLLDGLEQVHQAGMVHRDIKPSNIYVRDSDTSLVLLDFGSARPSTHPGSGDVTSMVSPGFAPFEQYHARGVQGPWSDLYAVGGVLYWLVTGHKPLEAPSRIQEDGLPPAAEAAVGHYSDGFLRSIDWALAVDERARPQSVAAFRPVFLGEAPAPVPRRQVPPDTGRDGDTVRLPNPPPPGSAGTAVEATAPTARARLPLLLVLGALVGMAVVAAIAWTRAPKTAPTTEQPAAAGTTATPAPAPSRSNGSAAKDSPHTSPKPETPRQFACSDLPFGLRVTCTLEGKDVIRKCAPDLKHWDNERPGCKRQSDAPRRPF